VDVAGCRSQQHSTKYELFDERDQERPAAEQAQEAIDRVDTLQGAHCIRSQTDPWKQENCRQYGAPEEELA